MIVPIVISVCISQDDGGGDEELQTMFDSLVCSVEAYLHSVLPTLANALRYSVYNDMYDSNNVRYM